VLKNYVEDVVWEACLGKPGTLPGDCTTRTVADSVGFVCDILPDYPVALVLHHCLNDVEGMLTLTHLRSGLTVVENFYSPYFDPDMYTWTPSPAHDYTKQIECAIDLLFTVVKKATPERCIEKLKNAITINNPIHIYNRLGIPLSPECATISWPCLTLNDVTF
jgi:hypothetical protein